MTYTCEEVITAQAFFNKCSSSLKKGLFSSEYPFVGVFAHFVFSKKSPFQTRGDCTIGTRLGGMTLISHQFTVAGLVGNTRSHCQGILIKQLLPVGE